MAEPLGEPLLAIRLWSGCHFCWPPAAPVWLAPVERELLALLFRFALLLLLTLMLLLLLTLMFTLPLP